MTMPGYTISHSGARGQPPVFQNIGPLNDVTQITITDRLKAKANTFNLRFSNPRQAGGQFKYTDRFQHNDEISINLGQGMASGNAPIPQSNSIIGLVKEWDYDTSAGGNFLGIKGEDLTSKMLDVIMVYVYSGGVYRASDIVRETIEREINPKILPYAINTSKIVTSPLIIGETIASDNKRVRDIIDEVSVDTRTGSGNFIYWMERSGGSNYFRWEPKTDAVQRQINTEGDSLSFQPNKSTYDVRNFLYINCGSDDNGYAIWTYAANFTSIAEVGWKEDIWPFPNAVVEARNRGLSGTALVSAAKSGGEAAGRSRLEILNRPRWKADVEMFGTNEYNLSNNIYLTSSGLGGQWIARGTDINPNTGDNYFGFKLRIQGISQQFSAKGWRTKLSFEEDAGLA